MSVKWDPSLYDNKHNYVSKYGEKVVELLNPQKDETIIDLGCGTGDLTKIISDSCKKVYGVDKSENMISTASSKFPEIEFITGNASEFNLDLKVDAVFSNAVLHWIPDAESVIHNITRHLKSGGRFIAEFGGKGCVGKIINTLESTFADFNFSHKKIEDVFYYPSISQYSTILEKNGFEVNSAWLFDRPTELKEGINGLNNFIEMFFNWMFENVSNSDKTVILEKVNTKLKPEMFDGNSWIADYRRIRIKAKKIE